MSKQQIMMDLRDYERRTVECGEVVELVMIEVVMQLLRTFELREAEVMNGGMEGWREVLE